MGWDWILRTSRLTSMSSDGGDPAACWQWWSWNDPLFRTWVMKIVYTSFNLNNKRDRTSLFQNDTWYPVWIRWTKACDMKMLVNLECAMWSIHIIYDQFLSQLALPHQSVVRKSRVLSSLRRKSELGVWLVVKCGVVSYVRRKSGIQCDIFVTSL